MTVKLQGPMVFGSIFEDVQDGTDFGDIFYGGYGPFGDVGDDAHYGYGGDDTMYGSEGSDTLDGGAGIDLADYSAAGGSVTVNLGLGTATLQPHDEYFLGAMSETDTLVSIERVRGSAFDDSIVGSTGNDELTGSAGNDTLDGGVGTDTASYADATAGVRAHLGTGSAATGPDLDVLRNIENLTGSAFADTLSGDGGVNVLDGGAGNDVLRGGAGNDTLMGGMGDDTTQFNGNMADYIITTQADGRLTVADRRAGEDGTDTLVGVRHLVFADRTVDLAGIDRLVASGAKAQSVTGLMDGTYVIAWQGDDGQGLFYRHFAVDGTPLGSDGQVNASAAARQQAPAVTALYDGGWVIVYEYAGVGGRDIALQRFNADGSANGAEVILGRAGTDAAPAVTATIDGGFAVVWQGVAADGTTDVYAVRFDWEGMAQPATTVNTTVAGSQGGAVVAEQDNGYMVAWQSVNGSSQGVAVQQFRWDGEALGPEVKLTTTGVVGSVGIATLYGNAGGVVAGTVVSWIQDDGNAATADDAVMVQRFDAGGNRVGSPIMVANAGFQRDASVTGLRDGGFIVTWDAVATDGTTTVMGRHYTADGRAAGAAWQVNQVAITGQVGAITVAEAADGCVIVTWTTTADGVSRVWQQAVDKDGAAEFVVSSSTGESPAAPQFTVREAGVPTGATLASASPLAPDSAGAPVVDQGRFGSGDLLVTGTADAGAAITLYDNGMEVARATADAAGAWNVELTQLRAGPHRFSAVAVDMLGQASSTSTVVALVVVGTIEGTAGNDGAAYFAEHGADNFDQVINAGRGNDTLDGGGGADTLQGGAGNDVYIVNDDGVVIVEEVNGGTDTVRSSVDMALAANVEHLVFTSATGRTGSGNTLNNSMTGGDGDDSLYGDAGRDTLVGGAGNDTLDGGAGSDVLVGGEGNDYYVIEAAGETITESTAASGGIDTVATTLASFTLGNGLENLVRVGNAAFTGTGNTAANEITGGAGSDKLDGRAGDDTLRGNGGADTLLGGAGADSMYLGSGSASVDGGTEIDTLYLAHALDAYGRVVIGTAELTLTGPDDEVIVVKNVERFVFDDGAPLDWTAVTAGVAGPGSQRITGTAGNDRLDGGAGDDTLAGGAGDDTHVVDSAKDRIEEDVAGGTDTAEVSIATRGATYVLAANVENAIVTSAAAVNVTGNELANRLEGNAASNTLIGADGNDTLDGHGGADRLDGGAGDDVYYVDSTADVVVEAAQKGLDTVVSTAATWTLAANVEDLRYAGNARATLTGNAEANGIVNGNGGGKLSGLGGDDTLTGGSGADSLAGGDGNDTLISGGGADTLNGGNGTDTAVLTGDRAEWTITRTADRAFLLASGTTTVSVLDVEELVFNDRTLSVADLAVSASGTAWSDMLAGTVGNDIIDGKGGTDTMAGLGGNDTYIVDNVSDMVVEMENSGNDTVQVAIAGTATYVLAAHVENAEITSKSALSVTGNDAANVLVGNATGNTLRGLDGNDWLDGRAGNDMLFGGAGDDVYVVDAAGDGVTELPGEGIDMVRTTLALYTLGAEVERLVYTGAGAFTGYGNGLANEIEGGAGNDRLAGGGGDDTLAGHGGNDTLDGGLGSDTAVFDGVRRDYQVSALVANEILLTAANGAKTVLKGVETVKFADGTLALADLLAGAVTLGNDAIVGSVGADTLDGKAGADTMTGLAGDDLYIVDDTGDSIVEEGNGGIDTARIGFAAANKTYVLDANVENAVVANGLATHVTGNAAHNALTGNAAVNTLAGGEGNDSLYGMAGNDRLEGGAGNDLLDGGAGIDVLVGGDGDDVYVIDNRSDSVVELAGSGIDTVRTTLTSYALGEQLENLVYTGSAAFTGTGNELDNLIEGSRGADRLAGGAGNDTLVGGAGNDVLTGDSGNDVFRLDLGSNDTVRDYVVGDDTIALDVTRLELGGGIVQHGASGAFPTDAGMLVFANNATSLTTSAVAVAIGSAAAAYAKGDVALFAIDNGTSTAVFKFTSGGTDAVVSAGELTQVATLTGVKDASLVDFELFNAF